MSEEKKSVYDTLRNVNVDEKIKKLEGLNYLPWANAWDEVLQKFPDATYEVCFFDGNFYKYDAATGYMVMTNMTIGGITRSMWLPVLNGAKKPMKSEPYTYVVTVWKDGKKVQISKSVESATMFDINKTLMRCLVKNAAMFGLGLYIYEKEENWEDPNGDQTPEPPKPVEKTDIKPAIKPVKAPASTQTKPSATPSTVDVKKETSPEPQKAVVTAPNAVVDTNAPIKKVIAASESKTDNKVSAKAVLTESHPNYIKVVAYANANKKFGIDKIVEALSTKYTITDTIKEKLLQIINTETNE